MKLQDLLKQKQAKQQFKQQQAPASMKMKQPNSKPIRKAAGRGR